MTNTTLTPTAIHALGRVRDTPRLPSRQIHWATRTVLVNGGYIVMLERFASGECVYGITALGRRTLSEVEAGR